MDTPRLSPSFLIGCDAEGQARVRPRTNAGNALRVGIIALQREGWVRRLPQSAEP
jgi:hypothetical protein